MSGPCNSSERGESRVRILPSGHDWDLIPCDLRIVGDQRKALGLGLRDQHAVKGITVVEREAGGHLGVVERYR